ncbi:MAG TPA: hypothetical protein VGH38_16340 [Bryobacteraceae bacterium]|jgi:hypothetical protein
MHSVRLVSFVFGVWLSGGLFMAWVATQNFRGVDRILEQAHPAARLDLHTLDDSNNGGPGATRLLLRYQVSEQNRFYFESWELVQLVLGTLLFFFLLFGTREDKWVLAGVLLMLVVTALQRFLLTPEITVLGRSLDFVPPNVNAAERSRFWLMHNVYSGLEVAKWAILVMLTGRLVAGRHRGRSSKTVRKQLDLIDKANHRHVDG